MGKLLLTAKQRIDHAMFSPAMALVRVTGQKEAVTLRALLTGICMTLCTLVTADETSSQPNISVECCGRLRHGVVAMGGETTGTTITFNRIVCELQLQDDAQTEFAKKHHKEPVILTGTLRKIAGTESKDRWIIDVTKLSEPDETKIEEGTQLTIRGMLQSADPRSGHAPEITIDTDDHVWRIELSADAELQARAVLLIGRPVLLSGSLERVADDTTEQGTEEKSLAPLFVRAKTLKRWANVPAEAQND